MITKEQAEIVAESLERASSAHGEETCGGEGGVDALLTWLEEHRVAPRSRLYEALKEILGARTTAAAVSTCEGGTVILWYISGLFLVGHGTDDRIFFIHEQDLSTMPRQAANELDVSDGQSRSD